MSPKRKYSDMSVADPSETGEKSGNVHNPEGPKSKKKKSTEKAKPTNMNWVKKRVRTIERRLAIKDGLPANVRYELEKELDHHRSKISDLADHKKRRDMIKKYHMVRFFGEDLLLLISRTTQRQLHDADLPAY
jgi:hypothetical protein